MNASTPSGDGDPPTIRSFIAAAQAADAGRLHALIDWPTSGVARFVASLGDIDKARRAEVAQAGMAEMLAIAEGSTSVHPLGTLPLRLAEHPRAARLVSDEAEHFMSLVRPGPVPSGVPEAVVTAVDDLRRQVDSITDVYRVTYGATGRIGLGLLPDTALLTLARNL